ncbi:hypothetical protein B0H13DRAFT_1888025 [Mycena leptocephala]|nr:hypothetical protein B0H13DRAFT_1888025 [Mycena leptocephala]
MQENVVSTTIKDWNETRNVRGGKEEQQNKKAKGKERKSKGSHPDMPSSAEFPRVQNECMNTVLAVCARRSNPRPDKKKKNGNVIPEEQRRSRVPGEETQKTRAFTGAYVSVSIAEIDLTWTWCYRLACGRRTANINRNQIQTKRITDEHEVAERSSEKIVLSPK